MSQFDNVIFGKKKFSSILEEIYNNQQKKDKQILALINELKPLITDIGDATLLVPLIKEYLDVGVKNDDILIKMAALAQRAMNTQESDGSLSMSDEEKDQLIAAMNKRSESQSIPQLRRRFKAGTRFITSFNKGRDLKPFFDLHIPGLHDLQDLLISICDNYGELHDYLDPFLKHCAKKNLAPSEEIFRLYHKIPKTKK